jgi:hypothetical protein
MMDKVYCELCDSFVNSDEIMIMNNADEYCICFDCMNKIDAERKKIPVIS